MTRSRSCASRITATPSDNRLNTSNRIASPVRDALPIKNSTRNKLPSASVSGIPRNTIATSKYPDTSSVTNRENPKIDWHMTSAVIINAHITTASSLSTRSADDINHKHTHTISKHPSKKTTTALSTPL